MTTGVAHPLTDNGCLELRLAEQSEARQSGQLSAADVPLLGAALDAAPLHDAHAVAPQLRAAGHGTMASATSRNRTVSLKPYKARSVCALRCQFTTSSCSALPYAHALPEKGRVRPASAAKAAANALAACGIAVAYTGTNFALPHGLPQLPLSCRHLQRHGDEDAEGAAGDADVELRPPHRAVPLADDRRALAAGLVARFLQRLDGSKRLSLALWLPFVESADPIGQRRVADTMAHPATRGATGRRLFMDW